jgi:hypothetical protein
LTCVKETHGNQSVKVESKKFDLKWSVLGVGPPRWMPSEPGLCQATHTMVA